VLLKTFVTPPANIAAFGNSGLMLARIGVNLLLGADLCPFWNPSWIA